MDISPKQPSQRHFLPALLWLITITGLSVMPGVQLPDITLFEPDKAAHLFVYGVLVGLGYFGFFKKEGRAGITVLRGFQLFLFASFWGILMEYIQGSFFPGRFFEVYDMIANCLGAAIGWGLSYWWFRKKSN